MDNLNLYDFKANRQPVGQFRNRHPFIDQNIQLESGDFVFLFSDGFPDQFVGEKGNKYSYRSLRELTIDIYSNKNPIEQLANEFEKWKGSEDQIDDVLLMGFWV